MSENNGEQQAKQKKSFKQIITSKVSLSIICGVGGFLLATSTTPSCTENHDIQISELETQLSKQKEELKEKDNRISRLYADVIIAEPWFKMSKEEQKKIKEENERVETERKAKEEEEKRKAEEEAARKEEEKRIAKENEEKNKYENGPTYDEAARNPDEYMYKLGKFKGKVVQVIEGEKDNNLRVAVDGNYDKILLVQYGNNIVSQRILEGDYITIYGMNRGIYSYTSTMGAKISLPSMVAYKIDI